MSLLPHHNADSMPFLGAKEDARRGMMAVILATLKSCRRKNLCAQYSATAIRTINAIFLGANKMMITRAILFVMLDWST